VGTVLELYQIATVLVIIRTPPLPVTSVIQIAIPAVVQTQINVPPVGMEDF